jgi:hypothetical protein
MELVEDTEWRLITLGLILPLDQFHDGHYRAHQKHSYHGE